jgi:hypothetical protein
VIGKRGGVLLLRCSVDIYCCCYGTTCIYVSCIGALHIEMMSWCGMWMVIVDDKCVWWIHTCDIWNWMVDKLCHNWICDLMNLCIGEIWWILWFCGLVYMYIGGLCWWLWIIELCSNCMSYLFVLIHLVNQFDDNYFDNNDEVRIVYVYTYDLVISVIMMIARL